MNRRRFLTAAPAVAALLALSISAARADVRPASVFADHMVLQREMRTPVWGTATPGEAVTVSIAGQTQRTRAGEDGKWLVRLTPLKAGGPHELTVAGNNSVRYTDVLVGDVWICSGQSNMAWAVRSSDNAQQEIAAANYPNIRLMFVPNTTSSRPRETAAARWAVCTPETVPPFSAVGYFFGRHLNQKLNVPIGLVHTNWGGTRAEAWTPDAYLRADPDYATFLKGSDEYAQNYPAALARFEEAQKKWQEAADKAKAEGKPAPGDAPRRPAAPDRNPNLGSVLYNGMIHPLVPMGIKGAIWYQGESNAGQAYNYRKLLPTMIRSWRDAWGQGDFPFLIVQLANYGPDAPDAKGSAWAELREAQTMTAEQVRNAGQAVTIDIGNPKDIHPTNKQDVGKRLALIAENRVYGDKAVVYSGPAYKAMKAEGGAVRLSFDHLGGGLEAKGGALSGFTIAGEDQKFVPAEATIEGDTVVVKAASVARPVAVRYGWANSPVCTLYNKAGLPAVPFRTDNWPGVTQPAPAVAAQK
ncbi:MAG TPA: sialate O-acetylesterase [Armatimonadaceae bacterium]|nr:sialate O-acetylesterase [Armatimonadaceae bacterium]